MFSCLAWGKGWDGSNQFTPLQDPPQMFSVALRVFEFLLSFRGIEGHLSQDVCWQDMTLQAVQGKSLLAFIEGGRDRAHQPVLQDPDTANTALVEIDPI